MEHRQITPIPVPVDQYYIFYLKAINGFIGLTDTGIKVLAEFLRYRDEGISPELLFSSTIKRKVRESCNLTQAHFNNCFAYLKKKNILIKREGIYIINQMIRPAREITFKLGYDQGINNQATQ